MDTPGVCPKCSGAMQPGFVIDHAHYGMGMLNEWGEGEPKIGWGGLKVASHRRYPIRGVRCESCGFVELYANRGPRRP